MDKKRFVDRRESRFLFSEPADGDPVLIVCPRCSKMARVLPAGQQPVRGYAVKAICTHCWFSNTKADTKRSFHWHNDDPGDSYFNYGLWLKIACCNHVLWAFNLRHLDLLEDFVAAELRENPKDGMGYANSSIASRLPGWLKSAKNRKQIMACIHKLRQMAHIET